ncbi:MAG: hypothetical protein M1820_002229 [Bogoriella megaspora]|nr:MAG: hypothetical protein M1820_002229 [Bogoriella megaspora]
MDAHRDSASDYSLSCQSSPCPCSDESGEAFPRLGSQPLRVVAKGKSEARLPSQALPPFDHFRAQTFLNQQFTSSTQAHNNTGILPSIQYPCLDDGGMAQRPVLDNSPGAPKPDKKKLYDQHFSLRGYPDPPREFVGRHSPVIAELVTNVTLNEHNNAHLAQVLTRDISQVFHRSQSKILVSIDHSAHLVMDGNLEPTYVLTISAVPTQLGPVCNKWRAKVLMKVLATNLEVKSERAIIKFNPVGEENFAYDGATILETIEGLEKRQNQHDEPSSAKPASSAIMRTLTKSHAMLSSKNSPRQKTPRPGSSARLGEVSTDSVVAPSPLEDIRNKTRWPTPTEEAARIHQQMNGNTNGSAGLEAERIHKQVNGNTNAPAGLEAEENKTIEKEPEQQPSVEAQTQQKKIKKRKSLYQFFTGK